MSKQNLILFKRPIDGALFMLEKGFKVFPLKPNIKKPAVDGWQEWAEKASYEKVEKFGIANPLHNWGIHCGATNCTAVDLDVKDGRDGINNMKKLVAEKNEILPQTLRTLTPSGGMHLFYKGICPNTNDSIAKGVETRSKGQYVVCPGSRIDGRIYELETLDVAQLPDWLLALAQNRKKEKRPISNFIPKGEQHNTLVSLAGTMRSRGMNADAIEAALLVINETQLEEPAPCQNIRKIAESVALYDPKHALAASDFMQPIQILARRVSDICETKLEKRDWVMQNRYIGGFISLLIAPGGVGKSTLSMLDAISVVTGKPLSGFEVKKQGAVWLYNTEDPNSELDRKFAALGLCHKIPLFMMENLHITSGRTRPFILAKFNKNGMVLNQTALEETVAYIKEHNIVLFIADPFVRTHEVEENANMQIDKVVWCFQRIADRTGCAIGLVHHTSKGYYDPGNADKSRGATSLINASRIAYTLSTMTAEETFKFSIPENRRKWYIRLDNAKANLQPPAEKTSWYEKTGIFLPNGDLVGAIKSADLRDLQEENARKEREASKRDIGALLNELMNTGEFLTINAVYEQAISDNRYTHLFEASSKTAIPLLISMLKEGLTFEDKCFIYLFESKKRIKHWIKCSSALEGLLQ